MTTQAERVSSKRTSRGKRTSRRPRNDLEIRPIRSDADLAAAIAQIERLWDAPEGSAASAVLDAVSTLVEAYEDEHYPIGMPTPVEAIRYHLDQEGLTDHDLEGILGSRARVWEIMNGKRPLSLTMIRALREHFNIPADLLIA